MEDPAMPTTVSEANGEANGDKDPKGESSTKQDVKLEELFADVDSDIDLPDSPGAGKPAAADSPTAAPASPT